MPSRHPPSRGSTNTMQSCSDCSRSSSDTLTLCSVSSDSLSPPTEQSHLDCICSNPAISEQRIHRNILIFGDVGAGKSSLVNLITSKDCATVSQGAKSCTLQSQRHSVILGNIEFALHDTAGLHEAKGGLGKNEYLEAIYNAHALISKLERSGGINLLVFVVRCGRITSATQETYNLFARVLCSHEVPVVVALTHSEECKDAEEWWRENEKAFKEYGIRSSGHACVTATRGLKNVYAKEYEQSKKIIWKLLLDHSGRVWKTDNVSWVKRLALHLRMLLSPHRGKDNGKDLKKTLIKRCGFSAEDALALSRKIVQQRGASGDAPEEKLWFDEKPGDDGSSFISLPLVPYSPRK